MWWTIQVMCMLNPMQRRRSPEWPWPCQRVKWQSSPGNTTYVISVRRRTRFVAWVIYLTWVLYCYNCRIKTNSSGCIFMPPAWKVRWGHQVFGSSVCPFLAHLSRRLEWTIVIAHRRSSVRRPSINFSHFQLLLQNRWMDFDETWKGWSTHGPLHVLLFFGQIHLEADPGRGQNRSQGVPSSRNFFFRLEGYSDIPNG